MCVCVCVCVCVWLAEQVIDPLSGAMMQCAMVAQRLLVRSDQITDMQRDLQEVWRCVWIHIP